MLAPLLRIGLKNMSTSSFSRSSPAFCDTFPHMLVTMTTLLSVVSPQSSRNILKFRVAIPVNRSEMRWM